MFAQLYKENIGPAKQFCKILRKVKTYHREDVNKKVTKLTAEVEQNPLVIISRKADNESE